MMIEFRQKLGIHSFQRNDELIIVFVCVQIILLCSCIDLFKVICAILSFFFPFISLSPSFLQNSHHSARIHFNLIYGKKEIARRYWLSPGSKKKNQINAKNPIKYLYNFHQKKYIMIYGIASF